MNAQALKHVRRALELLSLKGESASAVSNLKEAKSWTPFTMCVAEDIDRINGALPSPWLQSLSETTREAWEELRMAETVLVADK